MQPGTIEVDVKALSRIGSDVTATGGALQKAVPAKGAGLAPAPKANFSAETAACAAETMWIDDMLRLATLIKTYGQNLTLTASAYEGSDLAAAANHARGGRQFP